MAYDAAPEAPISLPPNPQQAWVSIIEALALPPNSPPEMVDQAYSALADAIQASAPDGVPATAEEINALATKHKLSRDFVRACFSSKDFKRSDLDRYVAQQRRLGRL